MTMTIANQRLMKNLTIEELERQRPDLVAAIKAKKLQAMGARSGAVLDALVPVAERIQAKNPGMTFINAVVEADKQVLMPEAEKEAEIPENLAERAHAYMAENPGVSYEAALDAVIGS